MAKVKKIYVDLMHCVSIAEAIARELEANWPKRFKRGMVNVYGVPRGGLVPASLMVTALREGRKGLNSQALIQLVNQPGHADLIVDDLIDSGATRERFLNEHPLAVFRAFIDKTTKPVKPWYVFPWESSDEQEETIEDNVVRMLQFIGEDPARDGLKETPKRVAKAYAEMFRGYHEDPASVMKVFELDDCDEMVILRNIEFNSFCEHHMLPFIGRAHIAYLPDHKVIGISKLARLLDIFAARLQIQERIGIQVTTALDQYLTPRGSACVIEAKHMCMSCRGVSKQHSEMITSSLTGVFLEPGNSARQEFMSLIRG